MPFLPPNQQHQSTEGTGIVAKWPLATFAGFVLET